MRCTGHCCRIFSLPYSPAELAQRAPRMTDGEQVAAMVVYLGHGPPHAFPGAPTGQGLDDHWYTCRNLDRETGNCRVYESRPAMCRDFPYGAACPYDECHAPVLVQLRRKDGPTLVVREP